VESLVLDLIWVAVLSKILGLECLTLSVLYTLERSQRGVYDGRFKILYRHNVYRKWRHPDTNLRPQNEAHGRVLLRHIYSLSLSEIVKPHQLGRERHSIV